jgi:predicted CXXCH cytochrome family protein
MHFLLTGFSMLLLLTTLGWAEPSGNNEQKRYTLPQVKKDCKRCHLSHKVTKETALLKKRVAELCIECHKNRQWPNEHKVDIIPPSKENKLPLSRGRMTCTTCHDVHENPYGKLLRLPERDLCIHCHAG